MSNIGNSSNDYAYWSRKPSSYKQITSPGTSIKTKDGILTGIFVGSGASVGTIKFWDSSTTGTGTVIVDEFTPPAGPLMINFPNVKFDNGLYLTTSTTGQATVFYK